MSCYRLTSELMVETIIKQVGSARSRVKPFEDRFFMLALSLSKKSVYKLALRPATFFPNRHLLEDPLKTPATTPYKC